MKMLIDVPDWIIDSFVFEDCDDIDFCELGETMYDVLLDGEVIKEDK